MSQNRAASVLDDSDPFPWRFKKGVSGNPGGKPKKLAEVVELARSHAPDAINELARIVREGRSERHRIEAAMALLDRGYGKPDQRLLGDETDQPLRIRVVTEIIDPLVIEGDPAKELE